MIEYYGESGDWSPLPSAFCYIWTNGCYDILHIGHIRLLAECHKHARNNDGSRLMVGIDSDIRVKELKGESRPINNQLKRAEMILSIKGVDGVFIYDTAEELEEIITELQPKIMVIGEEYKNKTIVGSKHCSDIIFFSKVEDMSTTKMISNICSIRRQD